MHRTARSSRDPADRHPNTQVALADSTPAHAAWIAERRVVLLDRASTGCPRYALEHEFVHGDLDDRPIGHWHLDRRAEPRADRLAADRFIRYDVVAALADATTVSELAAELDVTTRVLTTWAQHLHPARRAALAWLADRRDLAA